MKMIITNDSYIKNGFRRIKSFFTRDSHESYQIAPFGDDSCPPDGVKGVQIDTDNLAIDAMIGYFNKNNIAGKGEKRLFSVKNDKTESVYIFFRSDNKLEIGGNADNIAGYTYLKSGFDQLKSDFNNLVLNYNAHTQPVAGGVAGIPSVLASSSTADISNCKKENILCQ